LINQQTYDHPQRPVDWLRQYGLIAVVYIFATWFTKPWLMGDTTDYVDSIFAHQHGRYLQFWEFGHLFWRPLGWLAYRLFNPLTILIFDGDERTKITFTLISVNWITGLIALLFFRFLLSRVCDRPWIINVGAFSLIFSAAFLNYGQTGSAYVPGLALSLAGTAVLVRDFERGHNLLRPVVAGALLAFAVCLWFPFVLLVPAALALPLFLHELNRRRLQAVLLAAVTSGVAALVAYAVVVRMIGISNVDALIAWVTSASHGMNQMRGVPRMVFGFANSIIDLSGEGAVFKRFMKHDPFNPVSASELFRFSLWKLVTTYFVLGCVLLNLLRTPYGRRIVGLLVVDIVPTVIFALFIFEAGDTSRYIATLPLLFLAMSAALCSERAIKWTKYVIILFLAIMIVTNVRAMSASKLNRREERVEARVKDLLPLLKPESRVVTSHLQDEINNFTRDFLFNPINRNGDLRYHAAVAVNSTQVDHWRSDFSTMTRDVWSDSGDVWISKRLLTPQPRVEWNWVEGDDPRISWTDLYKFFSQFQVAQAVGGDDGFVLLVPSDKNKEILNSVSAGK
jgi:hypothetical protein